MKRFAKVSHVASPALGISLICGEIRKFFGILGAFITFLLEGYPR